MESSRERERERERREKREERDSERKKHITTGRINQVCHSI